MISTVSIERDVIHVRYYKVEDVKRILDVETHELEWIYDIETIKHYESRSQVLDVVYIHSAFRTLEVKYKSNQLSDDRYHRILNDIFSLIVKCGFYEIHERLFNHTY